MLFNLANEAMENKSQIVIEWWQGHPYILYYYIMFL